MCEWFLNCFNAIAGFASHPILGKVPCCQECADRFGFTLESE
ncbi:hypothetical protein SEA_ANNADREAMY_260 [Streptomyces phage Annadreamy]|uniref:Uncharacterized protein n=2 Tax=Annadreamyvirus annadreamy TaxID=2846392 RepID=A0A345GTR7_9CAUD|nr:hypothetical protein HWB75_gp019 [Streptomyces phage Annadreamy]AXG66339.1 hypothetical protein SEA_ANNADREAMY_260 [Streptomyces phage Annadreamy]QGH79567.1 hypothetical protein SEA_LIMPID_266 [Streptomyces phage Limpid]QOI67636.1 hypothetical protein SEA_BEUFFERT_270 [Streptomyces phage Beuffert]